MKPFPKKLQQKLDNRKQNNALRHLGEHNTCVDFFSNDYLGFSRSQPLFNATHQELVNRKQTQNGATGSRLLSGNHELYNTAETTISKFHNSENTLIYNSGYDANLGFFSCVPQRGDLVFYDEYSHASIRDGIAMGLAKAYKFKHNSITHLKTLLERHKTNANQTVYVVTESVFSMDGDSPDLKQMSAFCSSNNCYFIIDEAHALGVFGDNGSGLAQQLHIDHSVFARIITYGKGLGCHGAAILGSTTLKLYLINFSRPFIYTTGLSPHALATINQGYEALKSTSHILKLQQNIALFKAQIEAHHLQQLFIKSDSAIQCCIISGNERVKAAAKYLQNNGYNVKPILSPTISKGEERLRFCLHAYNSASEIKQVVTFLATFVKSPY